MTEGHAVLSPDGLYRYRLDRWWGEGPTVCFVMLNPSTADASVDDPTIRKCLGFAKRWGASAITVVNQFAYRATKPSDLRAFGLLAGEDAARGPENVRHLETALRQADEVVCAWGAGGGVIERPRGDGFSYLNIPLLARKVNPTVPVSCLGYTKGGMPRHPLMLGYSTQSEPFTIGGAS